MVAEAEAAKTATLLRDHGVDGRASAKTAEWGPRMSTTSFSTLQWLTGMLHREPIPKSQLLDLGEKLRIDSQKVLVAADILKVVKSFHDGEEYWRAADRDTQIESPVPVETVIDITPGESGKFYNCSEGIGLNEALADICGVRLGDGATARPCDSADITGGNHRPYSAAEFAAAQKVAQDFMDGFCAQTHPGGSDPGIDAVGKL